MRTPTNIRANDSLINNAFLVVVMLELFVMGSGRFLEVGPVTVRMVLFLLAVSCSVVLLMQKKGINMHLDAQRMEGHLFLNHQNS